MLQIYPVDVLLVTPPFTQLNTPYPATPYIKGFLNTKRISSFQSDLGIEVILEIFCKRGLIEIFETRLPNDNVSINSRRIFALKDAYIDTIDSVISFLQGKKPTLAHAICTRRLLPEASRFSQIASSTDLFGKLGSNDKAKFFATMYLEDLSDYIKEVVDPHFGFTRYAESLGRCANSFDGIYDALALPLTIVEVKMIERLQKLVDSYCPALLAMTVPFPGNLFAALRCGQWVKVNRPNLKVAIGGGFPNTELRSVSDPRVFEFFDFITLDDGESPMLGLLEYLKDGCADKKCLKRTFLAEDGNVSYFDNKAIPDHKQLNIGTPDYEGLALNNYISAIEIANPMHRLWSDGHWNKLTMAHGCYWAKCTFCDISLDYIGRYEPITAALLCDRMETLMAQTGHNGFHFVDEAAPPVLMRSLAMEIIKRKLSVSWWANIRFEKSFSRDLCLLLASSGCIAVSGGLEVASDRLLEKIQKGVTVAQVAKVTKHFTDAGILVHAYLMYGFPTQTAQETIDSLEMVRQMFEAGIIQSAFWHRFAMTAHSPVGKSPEMFGAKKKKRSTADTIATTQYLFAENDVEHEDPTGAEHDSFSFGLQKSLLNYMYGLCFDTPLRDWFDIKVPKTTVPTDFIQKIILGDQLSTHRANEKIIWLGEQATIEVITKSKKGATWEVAQVTIQSKTATTSITLPKKEGEWFVAILKRLSIHHIRLMTWQELKDDFQQSGLVDFELFWDNKPINTLYKAGLLCI